MFDLIHSSDVVEPHAGRGRALDANFDQRIVAGPLVEQFVGGVGDLVGSAGSSRPGHSGRGALERRGRGRHHGQRSGVGRRGQQDPRRMTEGLGVAAGVAE